MRTLLRARGASELVLADRAATGPVDALLGFGGWRTQPRRAVAELSAPKGGVQREPLRLRGISIGLPTRLPASAEPIAVLRAADGDSTKGESERARTVVWRMPVGLGHLIVNGASMPGAIVTARSPRSMPRGATWSRMQLAFGSHRSTSSCRDRWPSRAVGSRWP
jgi:hypothetical protein